MSKYKIYFSEIYLHDVSLLRKNQSKLGFTAQLLKRSTFFRYLSDIHSVMMNYIAPSFKSEINSKAASNSRESNF